MNTIKSTSLQAIRLRALAPKIALYCLVGILSVAGLRAALEGPAEPAPPARPAEPPADVGMQGFAEGYARAYLTWDSERLERRERLLSRYMSGELEENGGLTPARGSSQRVVWTTVVGWRRSQERTLVTVAAQTTSKLVHLTVPVDRDRRGFLFVSGYPAFVGPPATTREDESDPEDEVEDPRLTAVVERAITNYLARADENLLADLTPSAVVSLPAERFRVERTNELTWVERPGRVAVEVDAQDDRGDTWTLRYELDVQKRDRWYVRSFQVDPTFKGGN